MGFEIKNGMLKKHTEEPGVEDVTIPASVTVIGRSAFENCTSLTSVTIPDSVMIIGKWAFHNCTSLASIMIPNSVTVIEGDAFYKCTSLTSVTIPESVTYIGGSAFFNCKSLTSITIPESVTQIGDSVFRECESLTGIKIPDSVTIIGWGAFDGCTSLESVTIPNSLMQISEYAFYNCKFLTSVTFCGCTVDKRKWDWDKVSILDVKAMLDSKDYSVKMDSPVKYMFVTQVFLNTLQSEAEAYIKKNTLRIIKYFIDNDDYKTVKGLFECGKFVTKRNIMKLVEHSIAHTQNGGDMQIQAYIMDYNNKHFPNTDPFNNIKI